MYKFSLWTVATSVVLATLLLLPLLGTVVGAFSGWVVGWFFSETILGVFAALGVTGFKMWQVGATLGFIGGFFRSSLINNKH